MEVRKCKSDVETLIVNTKEFSKIVGTCVGTIQIWIRQKDFPAIKNESNRWEIDIFDAYDFITKMAKSNYNWLKYRMRLFRFMNGTIDIVRHYSSRWINIPKGLVI